MCVHDGVGVIDHKQTLSVSRVCVLLRARPSLATLAHRPVFVDATLVPLIVAAPSMTKTPVLSQFSSRRVRGQGPRSEPFLLAPGKVATTGPIERSKLPTRWLVLFLASLLLTCNYYCYDNPSALICAARPPVRGPGRL